MWKSYISIYSNKLCSQNYYIRSVSWRQASAVGRQNPQIGMRRVNTCLRLNEKDELRLRSWSSINVHIFMYICFDVVYRVWRLENIYVPKPGKDVASRLSIRTTCWALRQRTFLSRLKRRSKPDDYALYFIVLQSLLILYLPECVFGCDRTTHVKYKWIFFPLKCAELVFLFGKGCVKVFLANPRKGFTLEKKAAMFRKVIHPMCFGPMEHQYPNRKNRRANIELKMTACWGTCWLYPFSLNLFNHTWVHFRRFTRQHKNIYIARIFLHELRW